jgi:hypothetical protein
MSSSFEAACTNADFDLHRLLVVMSNFPLRLQSSMSLPISDAVAFDSPLPATGKKPSNKTNKASSFTSARLDKQQPKADNSDGTTKPSNPGHPQPSKIIAQAHELDLPKILFDGAKGLVNLGVEALRQGLERLPKPKQQETSSKESTSPSSATTVAPPKAPPRQQGQNAVVPTGGKLSKGGIPPPKDSDGSGRNRRCDIEVSPVDIGGNTFTIDVEGTTSPGATVSVEGVARFDSPPFRLGDRISLESMFDKRGKTQLSAVKSPGKALGGSAEAFGLDFKSDPLPGENFVTMTFKRPFKPAIVDVLASAHYRFPDGMVADDIVNREIEVPPPEPELFP